MSIQLLPTAVSVAVMIFSSLQSIVAQSWVLTGNTGTATSKLGTVNYQPVRFYTNNLQRVTLSAAGSLGIGTTAPLQRLHVVGRGLFTTGVTVSNGDLTVNTSVNTRAISGTSTSLGGIGVYGTANDFGVQGSAANFGVYGIGDFGVAGEGGSTGVYGAGRTGVYGEASADEGFGDYGVHGFGPRGVFGEGSDYGVYGSTYGVGLAWAGYFNGNVFSAGTYQGSDSKLKTNVAEFSKAMDILDKLKPRTYQYRQDGNLKLMNLPGGEHYGLIAQDVETVLPGLVKDARFEPPRIHTKGKIAEQKNTLAPRTLPTLATPGTTANEPLDFKAVNYVELIPIMIKGMQEQQQQIKQQQQQIEQLKTIIEKLAPGQFKNVVAGSLQQNVPNPVNSTTRISYSIPSNNSNAQLVLTDKSGRTIKAVQVTSSGFINLNTSDLVNGTYNYSLIIEGKIVETKNMVVIKK